MAEGKRSLLEMKDGHDVISKDTGGWMKVLLAAVLALSRARRTALRRDDTRRRGEAQGRDADRGDRRRRRRIMSARPCASTVSPPPCARRWAAGWRWRSATRRTRRRSASRWSMTGAIKFPMSAKGKKVSARRVRSQSIGGDERTARRPRTEHAKHDAKASTQYPDHGDGRGDQVVRRLAVAVAHSWRRPVNCSTASGQRLTYSSRLARTAQTACARRRRSWRAMSPHQKSPVTTSHVDGTSPISSGALCSSA